MGQYRFQFYGAADAPPTVRDVECANDGAAVEQAFRELREHATDSAVEIWLDARLITRMERPSEAFLTARSGLHGLR